LTAPGAVDASSAVLEAGIVGAGRRDSDGATVVSVCIMELPVNVTRQRKKTDRRGRDALRPAAVD
jgi:hypothetical protein